VTDLMSLPAEDQSFEFKNGPISLNGKRDIYMQVLEAFGQEGSSFDAVHKRITNQSIGALAQMVALLVNGGWLGLEAKADNKTAKRLNQTMAQASLQGAPYRYLCCAKVQCAFSVTDLDLMMIGLLNQSVKPQDLDQKLLATMKTLGKGFAHEGKVIEDEQLAKQKAKETVEQFLSTRHKNYQRLGAL
jgi:hypothetical protein